MFTLTSRFTRLNAVRGALVALSLVGGGLAAQLAATGVAHADTPSICDQVPHVAQSVDLAGRWNSNYGSVVLTQVGSSLSGTIAFSDGSAGTVTGCFDGQTVYYGYDTEEDSGSGYATLSANGCRLDGQFTSMWGFSDAWTLVRC